MVVFIMCLGYLKEDILYFVELWVQERDFEFNFIVGSFYDFGFVEVDDKEVCLL